ncbi:MAG TPA: acetyltransferase [Bryobacteraceae bacterium]|nr:acetyltransferase [Bryobacteraceae bacterium]
MGGWPVLAAVLIFLLTFTKPARAQMVLTGSGPSGTVNIFNTDLAVLEAGETRKDLPCTVTPEKPTVGFDLRFHAGYQVTIPLKDLSGSENLLNILFRVKSQDRPDQPIYFTQHIRVPAIEDDAKGDAYLQGAFDLGEGEYHIDWLMRDRGERVCSFSWDAEAALTPKDKPMSLAIAPESIQRTDPEQFKEEPPVQRLSDPPPLNVKVLVNFAPQNSLSSSLQPVDTSALVSILRSIVRDPRIGKFSIVAFNMQEQKVVYRQDGADRLDFPALGQALTSLNLGTVDLKRLSEKHGDTEFLANLVRSEVVPTGQEHPDAVIFAGPKALLDSNVSDEALRGTASIDFPVFYMNYNLSPQQVPWKDAISHAVRFFRGTEYTISKPRDLWVAVTEMVSRIVKSRNGKQAAAISTQ